MRIGGDKVFGCGVNIGEIATASAGNQDFLANAIGALQHGDAPSAFAGLHGTEQPGVSGAENQSVKFVDQGSISSE